MATMTVDRSPALPAQIQKPAIWDDVLGLFAGLQTAYKRRSAINYLETLRQSGRLDIEADQVEVMVDQWLAK